MAKANFIFGLPFFWSVVTSRKSRVDLWTFRDYHRSDAKAEIYAVFCCHFSQRYWIPDSWLPWFITLLSIILWNGKHYYRPVCLTNPYISYHVCGPPNFPGYGVIGEATSSMARNYYSRLVWRDADITRFNGSLNADISRG